MDEKTDLLDAPATAGALRRLARRGALDAVTLEQTLKVIGHTPDRTRWRRFLDILLLAVGAGSTVSGIFFFFAYNWAGLHRFVKFGLLELALLIAVALAFWQGLDRLPGKVALTAAGLLIGVLLAVHGQVYQTGADSYQLFLTWALLMLGWAVIGRFTPLWLIWLLLLNLALIFYWRHILGSTNSWFYYEIFALNGGGILAWELAQSWGAKWLQSRRTVQLLALPAMGALVIPTLALIFSSSWVFSFSWDRSRDPALAISAPLFLVVSAAAIYIYAARKHDLFMLTLCAFSLIVVINSTIIKLFEFGDSTLLLCMSMLFIGQAGLVVTLLRRLSAHWEAQKA